jgi:hypothetical protein
MHQKTKIPKIHTTAAQPTRILDSVWHEEPANKRPQGHHTICADRDCCCHPSSAGPAVLADMWLGIAHVGQSPVAYRDLGEPPHQCAVYRVPSCACALPLLALGLTGSMMGHWVWPDDLLRGVPEAHKTPSPQHGQPQQPSHRSSSTLDGPTLLPPARRSGLGKSGGH